MSQVTSVNLPKKTRLRFRDQDDLALLGEVLVLNPFENPNLWEIIQENIFATTQKKFLIKTLRDHLDLLIQIWLEKQKKMKDRSGVEELYTEKDVLCQNVYGLMSEFRMKTNDKKKKTASTNAGIDIRNRYANNSYSKLNKENYDNNVQIEEMEVVVQDFPMSETAEDGALGDHAYYTSLVTEPTTTTSKNIPFTPKSTISDLPSTSIYKTTNIS